MRRLVLLAILLLLPVTQALSGEIVRCEYAYGGEIHSLSVYPAASPYSVPSIAVGSYFRFRVVFQNRPVDLASVKIYAYADRDEAPTMIHQATYPYPPTQSGGPYGFTGLQKVYEPVRDGEMQYWCAWQADKAGTP